MADQDSIRDLRARAQRASMEAQRARTFTLVCAMCQEPFEASFHRATCDEACDREYRLAQHRLHAKKRTSVYRQAERQRAAAREGRAYRTDEQRKAQAAERQRQADEKRAARTRLTPEEKRERARLRAADSYAKNPEKWIAKTIAYKKAHPDKNREWGHRRRAKVAQVVCAPVSISRVRASRKTCLYCGTPVNEDTKQVDHVIAIAQGGEHSERNLVVACSTCNARKHDKPLTEWLATLAPTRRAIVEQLCTKRGLFNVTLPLGQQGPRPWGCGCNRSTGATCATHTSPYQPLILQALRDHGPMRVRAIMNVTGNTNEERVGRCLRSLMKRQLVVRDSTRRYSVNPTRLGPGGFGSLSASCETGCERRVLGLGVNSNECCRVVSCRRRRAS